MVAATRSGDCSCDFATDPGPRVGHPADGRVELPNIDRFGQVLGEAGLEAQGHVVGRSEPAQGDARSGPPGRELADDLQPAAIGQLDVADDQVVGVRLRQRLAVR